MIKINLAKKKKSGGVGGFDISKITGASIMAMLKGSMKAVESDKPKKKFDLNQPIPKLIVMAALCWGIDDMLTAERKEKINVLDVAITQTNKQVQETKAKISKIKGYEPIKKQMEDDEHEVRTKLEVVQKLLEDRNQPSKLMMHISQAIPEEVWLTNLVVAPGNIKFAGATPGYNQVSDFIRALKSSSDYTDVGLSSIQEGTSTKEKQKIQVFELVAKRRAAL